MTRLLLILALFPLVVSASTPSYWWSQMQVKPDAKTSQEFFFVAGTNMVFTYATNHVILNAGGGGGTTYITNNNYYTNTYYVTNNITVTQNTSGLTITQQVALWTTLTNFVAFTNVFSNGLLVASGQFIPAHCFSLLLPGGGYLTQPGGSTLCLP